MAKLQKNYGYWQGGLPCLRYSIDDKEIIKYDRVNYKDGKNIVVFETTEPTRMLYIFDKSLEKYVFLQNDMDIEFSEDFYYFDPEEVKAEPFGYLYDIKIGDTVYEKQSIYREPIAYTENKFRFFIKHEKDCMRILDKETTQIRRAKLH